MLGYLFIVGSEQIADLHLFAFSSEWIVCYIISIGSYLIERVHIFTCELCSVSQWHTKSFNGVFCMREIAVLFRVSFCAINQGQTMVRWTDCSQWLNRSRNSHLWNSQSGINTREWVSDNVNFSLLLLWYLFDKSAYCLGSLLNRLNWRCHITYQLDLVLNVGLLLQTLEHRVVKRWSNCFVVSCADVGDEENLVFYSVVADRQTLHDSIHLKIILITTNGIILLKDNFVRSWDRNIRCRLDKRLRIRDYWRKIGFGTVKDLWNTDIELFY